MWLLAVLLLSDSASTTGEFKVPVAPAESLAVEVAGRAAGAPVVLGSFLSFRPGNKPWSRATAANYLRLWLFRLRIGRGRRARLICPFPLKTDEALMQE